MEMQNNVLPLSKTPSFFSPTCSYATRELKTYLQCLTELAQCAPTSSYVLGIMTGEALEMLAKDFSSIDSDLAAQK